MKLLKLLKLVQVTERLFGKFEIKTVRFHMGIDGQKILLQLLQMPTFKRTKYIIKIFSLKKYAN